MPEIYPLPPYLPRHGEYKVPGGKLVVIDFTVAQDRLHSVRLSGDFFLEPPETLDLLNAALEGQRVDLDDGQWMALLKQALPPDTELYGLTLEAIVIVLHRGLDNGRAAQ